MTRSPQRPANVRPVIEVPSPTVLKSLAATSRDRVTPWETAFHEAGHAIAEIAMAGSYPDEIYLIDDPGDSGPAGQTATRSFLCVQPVGSWPTNTPSELITARAAWTAAYGAVLAAGDIARHLALGLPAYGEIDLYEEPEDTDTRKLFGLVADLPFRGKQDWVAERYRQGEQVITQHWGYVKILAAKLVVQRRLSREELWDLVPRLKVFGDT